MQIKRDLHKTKYTCISNGIFTDNRLSLAARALMGAVLSLPDSWDFSVNGIAAVLGINKTSALKYLHELEKFGYLHIKPQSTENGKFSTKQFCFVEVPDTENTDTENTVTENTVTENTVTENTVTENTVTENTVTENTVTENTVTENTVTENTVTENTVTENTVTVNSPQLNNNIPNTKKPNTNSINERERRAAITSHDLELLSAEFGAELANSALDTLNEYLNAKSRTINGVVVDNAELVNILCQTNTEDIRKALKAVQAKRPASFAAYFGTVLFNSVKQKAAGASGDCGGACGYSSGGNYSASSGNYGASGGNYGASGGNYSASDGASDVENIPITQGSMHPSSIGFDEIMQSIYGKYRENE